MSTSASFNDESDVFKRFRPVTDLYRLLRDLGVTGLNTVYASHSNNIFSTGLVHRTPPDLSEFSPHTKKLATKTEFGFEDMPISRYEDSGRSLPPCVIDVDRAGTIRDILSERIDGLVCRELQDFAAGEVIGTFLTNRDKIVEALVEGRSDILNIFPKPVARTQESPVWTLPTRSGDERTALRK